MAKSTEAVSSGEVRKQFGRYFDEPMIRPVAVSRNGRVRFVMVPADECDDVEARLGAAVGRPISCDD